ncbi:hypothetical protein GCM10007852_25360 [Agaribacter marinus]|uniref:Uncharacterized protein n=1 Tax=Agaribacter marinus TaxID=1431249 RepID=A0AA37WIZ7_9ALTE|nr:hypothetical protein GCM10007852_25360 [Agaribacter marinus]
MINSKQIKSYIFLIIMVSALKSHASLLTHESLEELDRATQNLIVEDWKSYPLHTILSNNTINGIGYQGENSLGEPIVTLGSNCRTSGLWCISHLTDNGRTRSFGSRSVKFTFNDPIQLFWSSPTGHIPKGIFIVNR